jgi:spiro-SPASM protein
MSRVAILNGLGMGTHALEPLGGGACAFERAIAAAKALPGAESFVFLHGEGIPVKALEMARSAGLSLRSSPAKDLQGLLTELGHAAGGHDELWLLCADAAITDPVLAEEISSLHTQTASEYTFADGYPRALAPELLRTAAIPAIMPSAAKADQGGGASLMDQPLFAAIEKDINAFDVETAIAPMDMRPLRLSMRCDSTRARLFLSSILSDPGLPAGDRGLLDYLWKHREHQRGPPAFYYIQVSGGCPQACSYCPYPAINPGLRSDKACMAEGDFARILDQAVDFSGEAVIGLSPFGEPGLHPRITALCRAVLERPSLSLLIETSGLGWAEGAIQEIAALEGAERLDWVVSLDAAKEERYAALRGQGFREAQAFAESLIGLFPGHVYPQAVRMLENEEELEDFYRSWKAKAGKCIIQKYDSFSGFLPERRVCDLSPLERLECWHLKRDLVILLDGSVPLCREDLRGEQQSGLAFRPDGIRAAWSAMEDEYRAQIAGEYRGICKSCDEHYTFNY